MSIKKSRMSFDVGPQMGRNRVTDAPLASSNIAAIVIAVAVVAAFLPLAFSFLPANTLGGTELSGAGMADAALRLWHDIAHWFR